MDRHFHVFAKPENLPDELKGGKSFALLKASAEEAIAPEEMIAFCQLLKTRLADASPFKDAIP